MQTDASLTTLIQLGAQGIFYILLLIFAIHLLILSYHWFTYGTSRASGLTALFIYLGGSVLCFSIMLVSLSAL
ncbi:hypothetical protein GW943_01105 [Candidatus Parcubacteria bacterium]|uniref:Uncharacterized protein n=1 Tax=Candidatus Kaiserbacteria bacterium CG10_big_fil_rev_8_21_14_0_10_47_16 TaxID=1974608 RepID=A0A2H0UF64_9BACT|nr:hypothetical protein [Candidatus Parcubacteria bacterium]PIR84425.1 MAG: hypothetical protein COU16_02485 [Candidatus Kaiserbacteria bacterium CG10_big_fil_rev_8_21_14_0_10_47_16]